jgi:hypothetical protein
MSTRFVKAKLVPVKVVEIEGSHLDKAFPTGPDFDAVSVKPGEQSYARQYFTTIVTYYQIKEQPV